MPWAPIGVAGGVIKTRLQCQQDDKRGERTIDTSALAKNFCTAFFLPSFSIASAVFGLMFVEGMAVAWDNWKARGGDADVADDVGVAMSKLYKLRRVRRQMDGALADRGGASAAFLRETRRCGWSAQSRRASAGLPIIWSDSSYFRPLHFFLR